MLNSRDFFTITIQTPSICRFFKLSISAITDILPDLNGLFAGDKIETDGSVKGLRLHFRRIDANFMFLLLLQVQLMSARRIV